MSMKPMKPMGGNKGQQVTVDLAQAENIVCKSCGNYSFIQSFACGNCGKVPDKMKSEIDG